MFINIACSRVCLRLKAFKPRYRQQSPCSRPGLVLRLVFVSVGGTRFPGHSLRLAFLARAQNVLSKLLVISHMHWGLMIPGVAGCIHSFVLSSKMKPVHSFSSIHSLASIHSTEFMHSCKPTHPFNFIQSFTSIHAFKFIHSSTHPISSTRPDPFIQIHSLIQIHAVAEPTSQITTPCRRAQPGVDPTLQPTTPPGFKTR